MAGREQSQGDTDEERSASPADVLVLDDNQRVQSVSDVGELVFPHVDDVVGSTLDSLADDGFVSGDTVERYRKKPSGGTDGQTDSGDEDGPNEQFEIAIPRTAPLEPIGYQVSVSETEENCTAWALSETGPDSDSTTLLARLRNASEELQKVETVPEVMETLERFVSDILGPTGIDVRLGEPTTNEFWRVNDSEDTIPVDDQQAIDATLSPYAGVLADDETKVLDEGQRQRLGRPFDDVAISPVGDRGTLTIGRVGTAISEADIDALDLLAEYAWTAIEELRNRSTVTEQQTELDRYETLVESIPDPVYSTDEKGRITVANRAFEHEFGYDPEKHHDSHISEFTTTESAAKIREEIRTLVADAGTRYTDVSITGTPSGGREREYSASVGVVDHDGDFDGAVGVLRDMTDRHRQEEISKVLNRALRHNLRTTTNNIKGYAEVTQEQVDGDLDEYLGIIQSECDWLMKLADTLRNVRKSVQRGMGGEDVIPITELIEPVLGRYREQYPDAQLETHYNTEGRIEGGTTLRSALSQIVENAIVHDDNATPSVELWVANAPKDGWIDVHVEDDGPGIPQNEIELVMGETEITQLQHGSGIGLWVSRWLVETFDGELLVESGPDGSVVTLRLRKLPG